MEWNRETFKQLRFLVAFAILLYLGIEHFDVVVSVVGTILSLIFPFILGGCIAFILNVPMRAIEKGIIEKIAPGSSRFQKFKRPISLLLALLFVIGIVFVVIFVVAPDLWNTFVKIGYEIPGFVKETQDWAEETLKKYPDLVKWINSLQFDWMEIWKNVLTFIGNGAGDLLNSTVSIATGIVSGVTTVIIAFVFSVYILFQKETLGRQGRMVVYAFFKEKQAKQIVRVFSLTHRTFASFLTGQCLEAVILGCMFFVTMTILKMPYALLIGVLIAFTALIPIFGAFIGCVVGAFLILIESPMQALGFLILFQILQQIEGNLIYPRVVGGSVKLPSIWVLVAVSVGGSLMGIVGMLIFIPIVSVMYALFSEYVKNQIQKKNVIVPTEVISETTEEKKKLKHKILWKKKKNEKDEITSENNKDEDK